MEYSRDAQNFIDGLQRAIKLDVRDEYIHYFLKTYRQVDNTKYSKDNALRIALGETDTDMINLELD
tara:strand:+ start:345 stop:542 length:198 start_codon:yes stop_codon:yes gene_type:complete